MIRVLVSSCLLGEPVRYHGGHAATDDPIIERWQREGRLVPVCPELAGGFAVPRAPAEIQDADGHGVLSGAAAVRDRTGTDLSAGFVSGARAAVEAARRHEARLAVLKDGSPSCGTTKIHDGSFAGRTRPGPGVTAAALTRAGVRVFAEHELAAAARFLEELETREDRRT